MDTLQADGHSPTIDPVERAVSEIRGWLASGRRCIVLLARDPEARRQALAALGAALGDTHGTVGLAGSSLDHRTLGRAIGDALGTSGAHPERDLLDLASRRAHAGGGVVFLVEEGESLSAACAARLSFLTNASGGTVRLVVSADPGVGLTDLVRGAGQGIEFVALHDALSVAPYAEEPPPPSILRRSMLPLAAAAMLGALLTLPDYGLSPLAPISDLLPDGEPERVDLAALASLEEPALQLPREEVPAPRLREPAGAPAELAEAPAELAEAPAELAEAPAELAEAPAEPAAAPAGPVPLPGAPAPAPVEAPTPVAAAPPPPPDPLPMAVPAIARMGPRGPSALPEPPAVPVVVNAYPAAVVEVDGVRLGTTPVVRAPVQPGVRRFTARFDDGRRVEREIDVGGEELYLVFQ